MLKRFYLRGEINSDSLENYIQFLNSLNPEDEHQLIIDSEGGWCYITETLIHMIDSFDKDKFSLVGTGSLNSSALDLFVFARCNKSIVSGTTAVVHKVCVQSNRDLTGNLYNKHSTRRDFNYFDSVLTREMLADVLSQEELEAYEAGADIYIGLEEIKKLAKI